MITVGFSTRQEDNSKYVNYIRETCMYKNIEVIAKVNKGNKSLSQVYNEIIDESTNDIVVLIHDDLEFDTKNWGDKLLKVFEKNPEYSILGLAGTKYLDSNAKWWSMPSTMYGIVNHKHQGKKWTSIYSPELNQKVEETIIVDGLFLSFNKNKINYRFDEDIPGFHFYDLGFCLPNYLSGIKIGVTSFVRVTHLSIGQTNQQWEDNRISFSEKYKNSLPLKIDVEYNDLTTYIICHNQEIIESNIKSKKYDNLGNVFFMFVGNKEYDKIGNYKNVIIVRNLKYNIEEYPYFTAFTAWYAIWKNKLCETKYLNLLEYDTNIKENFEFFLKNILNSSPKIISYFPFSMRNYHFIDNPNWVSTMFDAIKQHYKFDIEPFLRNVISENLKQGRDPMWGTTNNICFEHLTFDKYMKWVSPLINYLKDDVNCGHAQERGVTFFSVLNKVPVYYFPGYIEHLQLDSHKTQGHEVDYEKSIEKLKNSSSLNDKKKNAIVVLSRGYNDIHRYNTLIKRNINIYDNIISKVDDEFDIIIYHEGNITKEHQNHISSVTPKLNLKFLNVKTSGNNQAFNDAKNLVNMDLCPPTPQSKAFPLGYKHMCHFWSIDFINYLKDYEYIIRIDEDCFVSNFDVSILKEMKEKEIHFISPYFQEQDEEFVIVGMEKLWEEFISENNITPVKSFKDITCPYTNFMIVNIKFLKENEIISKILNKIDMSHGIYSNRWGDLPIWGMILSTLVDEKNYLETKKISYFHGSHNKTVND